MRTRLLFILLAGVTFAVASALAVVIFRGLAERNRLESQKDATQTINQLLSSLRDYEDFGAAIEGIPALSRKIIGVAMFQQNRSLLYAWGDASRSYPPQEFESAGETGQMAEMYVENPTHDSVLVLMRPMRPQHPPPEPPPGERGSWFVFDTLRQADLISIEIRELEYWQRQRLQLVLFPIVEAALASMIVFVTLLIAKNIEYRAERERQKNLVMLGTAASTLAHEIKNPLMAIRLQTGILSRSLPGGGCRELDIIDDEVNRLSMLTTRVNDVLRDPTGQPRLIDVLDVASEVGMRLCGRSMVDCTRAPRAEARMAFIDPERLRSIVENLLRNALESGGKEEEVAIEIAASGGHVYLDVLDRGAGMPKGNHERVFDPFFTTKSRGTGVGLAICQRFAVAARGNLTLEDRPDGGIRARLVLPRKVA